MPILAGDVKLIASAIMSDVPEGGGAPSATVIEDATTNTIFPDISEIDRAGGRVNLRKVFAQVRTADTDGYFGVNVIVAEPFQDPRVSATLFTTNDVFDRRSEAASRMESYLARGAAYAGLLFGDHLAGQMVVTILQRIELPLPVVGDTFVLTKNQGLSNEFAQFVRVTGIDSIERTFDDEFSSSQGSFKRMQVTMSISDSLQQDFNGFNAIRNDASVNYTNKTQLGSTVVADAARYYGITPLTDPVAIGDFSVQAESIFTQLVPSTRIEVPVADARMTQQISNGVSTGGTITQTLNSTFTPTNAFYVGGGILPGSLTVVQGAITLTDKAGLLMNGGNQVGLVDYDNGVLTLSTPVFSGGVVGYTVTYDAAVRPSLVNRSFGADVTQQAQRLSWVVTLDVIPVRGSLQVSYRAQNRWYVLQDDGSGALRGSSPSIGAGTLNYTTGTVTVTLGALPDVGSKIIYVWGSPSSITSIEDAPVSKVSYGGNVVANRAGFRMAVGTQSIKPGSITIAWNDGTARSMTDNGTAGLAGYGTGLVQYQSGTIFVQPTTLPPKGTVVTVTVNEVGPISLLRPDFTDAGANWTLATATNIEPKTFTTTVVLQTQAQNSSLGFGARPTNVIVYDNGAGQIIGELVAGSPVTLGTINYTTGLCTFPKTTPALDYYDFEYAVFNPAGFSPFLQTVQSTGYTVRNGTAAVSAGGFSAPLRYSRVNGGTGVAYNFTVDQLIYSVYRADAQPTTLPGNPTAPITLLRRFAIGSNVYSVVGMSTTLDGALRMNVDPQTGVGTVAGTVSRFTHEAAITEWQAGAGAGVDNPRGALAPASAASSESVDVAVFRTAVAPLVNSGFGISANWLDDNAVLSATAPANGQFATGSAVVGSTPGSRGVFGTVDYTSGVIELRFGRRVPVSMAADPGVIDASYLGISGVQYLQLQSVRADSLRYNAVGYSYLPLNPAILGLNPVRLPADGRVPIFRQGTFAVLGHTGTVGPATVTNGQTINCGRVRLSRVRVVGANGAVINAGYTTDLDAGTVTFTNVSGYSQPVEVEHRIEDTVLVSDAQISGQITFTRPSTHVYPFPGSYISSALVAGDVQARVQPAFDQVTWTGVWSDSAIGNAATGTYNDTLHPITTTNAGALTERWAVRFTNTTAFEVFGENVGVIATGNTSSACNPTNPTTGQPYFSIPAAGWGGGWSTGNVVRFNTVGATVPVWIARTILQGPETVDDDDFTVLVRGDVNKP